MKKCVMVILGIIVILLVVVVIDLFCIFNINRPLFAIKEENVYRGILYDTYNCLEYSVPQIKMKWNKYSCKVSIEEENTSIVSDNKIEIIKGEFVNSNKFNKYLERDGRIIYLASNIEEIYYYNNDSKVMLNDYITKSYQTIDDSILKLTSILEHVATLRDGGTSIYKSEIFDVTLVKCNTLSQNKNVYIGDYSMSFDDTLMCK